MPFFKSGFMCPRYKFMKFISKTLKFCLIKNLLLFSILYTDFIDFLMRQNTEANGFRTEIFG